MKMTVEEFFTHFVEELKINESLRYYYKYLDDPAKFEYRKAYFCQRLQYIIDHIDDKNARIWDCGCGFGTTAMFLSINGISSHGTTLEHYIKQIPERLKFWSQFGDVSKFTYSYENIFDHQFEPNAYDLIIIQDTLHHLEPLQDALKILNHVLSPKGQLLIIEENGNNVIQNAKLYKQRGNKRIIEIYDESLKKNILLGNENIRSLSKWESEFQKQGFKINPKSVQYIRYYLPFMFPNKGAKERINKEQKIWKRNNFLKEYFFFGINFMVSKK
ncbi:MAG: class I SAM-dependent methyltransferase [Bacteroidetes bacterium]|nr:MAG: class I SAM-dependent methyltransferase [Bacteroidota bacterium]MBL1145524.1 class I SAM-dependent methyltransferase [Bacteroidota bacterium]MCB0803677.1 class I SAM-dependent methyltransferase [Flavobacteriales bacterium]NOG58321.1 class I SAM-dependent methyltransferase [Bacteroidota bacterium]